MNKTSATGALEDPVSPEAGAHYVCPMCDGVEGDEPGDTDGRAHEENDRVDKPFRSGQQRRHRRSPSPSRPDPRPGSTSALPVTSSSGAALR